MDYVEVIREGKTYRVLVDGKPLTITSAQDLKAFTLDVRDRDRAFYDRLMEAERYREALDSASRADSLLDAIDHVLMILRRRKAALSGSESQSD